MTPIQRFRAHASLDKTPPLTPHKTIVTVPAVHLAQRVRMNDIVLANLITSFLESRGLAHLADSEAFEAFATSTVLRRHHQIDIGDLADGILVGGELDAGLDAVAIIVNGRPANATDDVEFFLDQHRRLDVEFAFIQAKTSPTFDSSAIGTFTFGVEQFFNSVLGKPTDLRFSDDIQSRVDLAKRIYSKSVNMRVNPSCSLYYVTTGTWQGAPEPLARLNDAVRRLEGCRIFSSVSVQPIGADDLKDSYRKLERGVLKSVEISRTAVFPQIEGVEEAYIGLLSGDQFLGLISTDDGNLNRELFYDNVRDFQGHNPVNAEIEETLKSDELLARFPLLNNGMTVVAGGIKRRADTFDISDFQIVNGCQTAHVLFNNRERVGKHVFVPVKIVVTSDRQTVNDVIKATNRQTPVLPEALESLTPFHRELEEFYLASEGHLPDSDRIYYERRSRQYAAYDLSSSHVVTLTAQIKSFVGMYLNEPHSHPRYYGELLTAYEGRLFALDHKPHAYYSSGVAMHVLERWLSDRGLRDVRAYKYHLLYVVRVLVAGHDIPRLNSRGIEHYALSVAEKMRATDCGDVFERAVKIVQSARDRFELDRPRIGRNPPHRLRDFTALLMEEMGSGARRPPTQITTPNDVNAPMSGVGFLKWFDQWKRFGFIEREDGEDLFVHMDEMVDVPWVLRIPGTPVRFDIGYRRGDPRPVARAVRTRAQEEVSSPA